MKKLFSSLLAAMFLVLLAVPASVSAATVQLYLNPSTKSVQVGNSFSVQVYVNTTQAMGYVKADISFPSSKLQVTSLNNTNTAYPYYATYSFDNSGGTISFTGNGSYTTGNAMLVGTINFKASAAGSASVTFKNSSIVAYSPYNANSLTSTSGGTYTIASIPAPTCPAGQTGTPPNCTTPPTGGGGGSTGGTGGSTGGTGGSTGGTGGSTGGTTGGTGTTKPGTTSGTTGGTTGGANNSSGNKTTPKTNPAAVANTPLATLTDPNKLNISDQVVDVNYDTGTIAWKTNFPSASKVEYGTDANNLDSNQSFAEKLTDHNVSLVNLIPGKRYYYRISASSDNGQNATYEDQFTTKGFPVSITITTPNKKPIKNARVTIDEDQFTTNKNGIVEAGLSAEDHKVIVSANGKTKSFSINVESKDIPSDGADPETQTYSFVMPAANNIFLLALGGLGGLIILGAVVFGILKVMKHPKKRSHKAHRQTARGPLPLVQKELITDQPLATQPEPQHAPPAPQPEPLPPAPVPEIPAEPVPIPQPQTVVANSVPPPPAVPLHEDLPHMVARANAAKAKAADLDEPKDMFEQAEELYHYNEKFGKKK